MAQLNFHKEENDNNAIILKFTESYKTWHAHLVHLPRLTRYTLGVKIDNLFTDCLELSLMASYAKKENKLEIIKRLSVKFDALKFFIKVLWELKALDEKKYLRISMPLNEIGKMIGGWLKLFQKINSFAKNNERE